MFDLSKLEAKFNECLRELCYLHRSATRSNFSRSLLHSANDQDPKIIKHVGTLPQQCDFYLLVPTGTIKGNTIRGLLPVLYT